METLLIENIGTKGLATDPKPWTLPAEFINLGSNFRVYAGSIQTNQGTALNSTAPVSFNPGHIFKVGSTSNSFWIICGRTAVYVFDGSAWTDISSVAGYSGLSTDNELLWNACMLGQIPIVNNPQAHPEYWSPQSVGTQLQPLLFSPGNTFASQSIQAKILRSHRNFLFAMNLVESGVDFPDTYRWSHPADINGLPATWDETNASFLAGRSALGGDGGQIIDGRSLRDAFCIYSENSIDVLDYTNDEFVWRRRELSSTAGLLSRNCIAEVKGVHYFLSNGDIVKNDGNKIESIVHNIVRNDIRDLIDSDNYDRSFVVKNDSRKEIWFCFPTVGNTYPDIAYVYNWRDLTWAVKDLFPTPASADQGAFSGIANNWDAITDTWNSIGRFWNSSGVSVVDTTILGIKTSDSTIHILDPKGASDNDLGTQIYRSDFPLGGTKQVTSISRVYPHIEGAGDISVRFGSQDYPGASIRWKPSVLFNPSTDRKIDIRTTGELHAWEFTSVGQNRFSMSGMTIEYSKAGFR